MSSPGVLPIERAVLDTPGAVVCRLRLRTSRLVRTSAPLSREVVEELAGERAEVDVGAGGHAGRGERLALAALLHEQRCPRVDDAGVLAVLDAGEQRLLLERLVALPQVRDVLLALHEGHVRGGVDEVDGRVEHALLDEGRPELAALLELLVDRDRLGRVDRAVGALGHVVQLAEGGVAGAGVVPGVRALEARHRPGARRRRSSSRAASSCRRVPSVALMMPPPIRTTSTEPSGMSLSSGWGRASEGVSVTRQF